jgi:hypothetical protein
MKNMSIAIAAVVAVAGSAFARTESNNGNIAAWTFEVTAPANAGPHMAEGGVYAASSFASAVTGGTISSPVGNGSARSFSSNGWSAGNYYQFATSSSNYENLTLSWDQVRSSTGPANFDLRVSTDGVNFVTLVAGYVVRSNSSPNWSTGGPRVTDDILKVFIPAAYNDQANLVFRLVNLDSPASSGTNRVDNVFLNGTIIPAPGTLALAGIGGLLIARRRRA